MKMHGYDEPVYLISVVAKVLTIHPQTLRQYEREGLVSPSRTDGKMRLYSQRDIDRIKLILRLTRDLGVNLAGVDVVMQLKEKLDETELLLEELRVQLEEFKGGVKTKNPLVKRKTSYDIILFGE
ncbi:MAG: helix-turn-helix transcriptional regulator [Sulfurospirillum sp.]|nr:helix-turn-helix transcriptional regulator [Sulfurospirillum sp.]